MSPEGNEESFPPWIQHIDLRTRCTEDTQFDSAALTKGEVRYLLEAYVGYEKALAKGVENLMIPYPEPGSALAHAAIANTLLKAEIANLRQDIEAVKDKNEDLSQIANPALPTLYEIAQRQLAWATKQIEERDRALATQIEAFQTQKTALDAQIEAYDNCREGMKTLRAQLVVALQEKDQRRVDDIEETNRLRARVAELEKKLTRLTGLAEDLVQEASEA